MQKETEMIGATLAYCIIYFLVAIAAYVGTQKMQFKNKNLAQELSSIGEITLIVPFRDEAKRILPLLQSLSASNQLPKEILFVNDHSCDQTIEVITNHLKINNYRIIHSQKDGKKAAIHAGVEQCLTPYFLTMDADVSFGNDYFDKLFQLAAVDMAILPVKMQSKGGFSLFELDVYLVNVLNCIVAGYYRPIVASGANLLVKKTAYLASNTMEHHAHILSGDDQFLLNDFVQSNKIVAVYTNKKLAVTTPSPASMKDLINQRLRWIQKTPHVNDGLAKQIGIIHLGWMLILSVLVTILLLQSHYSTALFLIISKSAIDAWVSFSYFKSIEKLRYLVLLPLYEMCFPIYTLLLAFISLFYKPMWKQRPTLSKQ